MNSGMQFTNPHPASTAACAFLHVWRYTVEYRAWLDCDIHVWNVTDLRSNVRFREDGFAQVRSNLLLVNLEGGDESNVFDFVRSETGMHEPGC